MAINGQVHGALAEQQEIDGSLTPSAKISGKIGKSNVLGGKLTAGNALKGNLNSPDSIKGELTGSAQCGNYEKLRKKPRINSVELVGNKSGKQLALIDSEDSILEYEIDQIIFGGLG